MKVVLFCGGRGMRLREYSENIPKPLVPVEDRPILWHIMKYYASYGHNDFLLCLGYKSEAIKRYFMEYQEYLSNDFVLEQDGSVNLLSTDMSGWRISFLDTGLETNIGGRLLRAREHLEGESMFLANYGDTLTDVRLDRLVADFEAQPDAVASFVCIRPPYSFHMVNLEDSDRVSRIEDISQSDVWMNGGYFTLRQSIFDYLDEGDELVVEAFEKLYRENRLIGHRHNGFWACMDTFKEKQALDELAASGAAPWQVWKQGNDR